MLYHIHVDIITLFVCQSSNGIVNLVLTCRSNVLNSSNTLQLEGGHNLQGLMVLLDTTEPVALLNLVSNFYYGGEIPFAVGIQRFGVLSTLQEDTVHLVEIVLQTIEILT